MSDPYVAEIRIFAGNYAPKGWALCNGQTLPIRQNTALFALLGTYYGGDGVSTFGLPDLQGRAPMHWGQGSGLTQRSLGEKGGSATVTLDSTTLPAHSHGLQAAKRQGGLASPTPAGGTALAPTADNFYTDTPQTLVQMSLSVVGSTGGNQPHNNMQPYTALTYIIALEGIFPPRS